MPLPGQPPVPPALASAPPHAGGAVAPQGNAGNAMAGLEKVKVAVKALQDALPSIPMGSSLHTKVLNAAKDLSKELGAASENSGPPIQALLQMIQQAKANQPNAALARMGPQPAAGGAPAMPVPPPAAAAA